MTHESHQFQDEEALERFIEKRPIRVFLAFISGILCGLAHPPFDLWYMYFIGIPLFVWAFLQSYSFKGAILTGWFTGIGYFGITLFWMAEPFLVEASKYGWLAPLAVSAAVGGFALYWAVAFGFAYIFRAPPFFRMLALAASLASVEYFRAHLFTGFPWAMISYGLIETSLANYASVTGPYLLTLLLIVLLGVFGLPNWDRAAQQVLGLFSIMILSIFWIFSLSFVGGTPILFHDDFTIRVVQPNINFETRRDPEELTKRYEALVKWSGEAPQPNLVVWPESAVPWSVDESIITRENIASDLITNAFLMSNVVRKVDDDYYTSLALFDRDGTASFTYDKHHLVPFGEYMPFRSLAEKLGLNGFVTGAIGQGFQAGNGPKIGEINGVPPFLPMICYETIFPQYASPERAKSEWIVQVTNDMWFGNFSGPYQHLAQARFRAIESGLPVVRAANTGMSAVIAPNGYVISGIPLNEAGFIDVKLPKAFTPTYYSRYQEKPFFSFVAALYLLAIGGGVVNRMKNRYFS